MRLPAAVLIASMFLPGLAAADDSFEAYIEQMIEEAKENGAIVNVESHSSVSTGGQVAGAGQTVTDGDVSASSRTETYINAGSDGGEVYVKTETSRNGETTTKEYSATTEPGEPVQVNVSASANTEGATTEIDVQGEAVAAATSSESDSESHDESSEGFIQSAIDSIPNFFKKVIDFVKFW